MRNRLVVAALLAVAATVVWGAGANTQEGTSEGVAEPVVVTVPVDVAEQAQAVEANRVEQHSRLADHMARIEARRQEHMAKMVQLGDRAPTETIPPLATIAPSG